MDYLDELNEMTNLVDRKLDDEGYAISKLHEVIKSAILKRHFNELIEMGSMEDEANHLTEMIIRHGNNQGGI